MHRPLFWEFDDAESYKASHKFNFMLGRHLKVSLRPYMTAQNTTQFYFPQGFWCNLLFANLSNQCFNSSEGGLNVTLVTNDTLSSYVHLREGSIVALQGGEKMMLVDGKHTTSDLIGYPVSLFINPSCNLTDCSASGSMYNDDGLGTGPSQPFKAYNFSLGHNFTSLKLEI